MIKFEGPKWVHDNCVYLVLTGSHAYGTNTPESDYDYAGITVPPKEVILPHLAGKIIGFDNLDTFNSYEQMKEEFDAKKLYGDFIEQEELQLLCEESGVECVPELYRGVFDLEHLQNLAEEPSALYNGGKEGLVIKTVEEKYKGKLGRTQAKYISKWYFLRKEK